MQIPLDAARLLAFAVVAREKSFSRAARALGKTQSAVSQAVLHLEGELGQRLLVRDGRESRPTEAGRVLLEHAERILVDMERARERLAGLAGLRAGRLAIGTSDTLAYYLLPPVLAAYRARFPGIELRLDNRPSPSTAVEVAEGRVDVGVVALPLPPAIALRGRPLAERITVEPLSGYDDAVVFPVAHAFRTRRRVRLTELAAEPLVLLDGSTGTRAFLDAAFRDAGLTPRVSMEMSSVEVLKRLVELGFGVSVVPALSVSREVAAGVLAARPLAAARSARRVGLVLPRGEMRSPAAAAFADLVRAELRHPR